MARRECLSSSRGGKQAFGATLLGTNRSVAWHALIDIDMIVTVFAGRKSLGTENCKVLCNAKQSWFLEGT